MKAMVSKKANQRILAAIMACVMLFSLIYTSSPSAAETETHKNCITVSVVDEDGKAVEGARVEYSISSKQEGKVKSDIATTDGSGVVEVFSTTEYEKYPEGDLSVSAEVTKTGYEGAVLAGDVTSDTHDFQMTIKENKITGVVIKPNDLKYNGSAQELVSVTGTKEGDKVSYKLGDGEFSTEVPKATEIGTYNVSVKVEREGYPNYEENVEVTIAYGQITGIEIKPYDGKYDGQEHELVSVSGTVAGDVVKYYVGDDEEGTTTVPKATEVGTYPIKKITIERTNYDTYVQENISANIALGQINGGDLIKAVKDLEYNGMDQELVDIASNAEKNGYSFKFKLEENAEYSDELPKAKDAGDYKVYVKISKEKYEDKEMEINTSIKKADPGLKFNDEIDDVIKDGIKFEGKEIADINFSASLEKTAEFDKDITYEIINNGYDEKDDASEIASIDKSGKVTIKKGGYILKVIAKVDEHNNYAAASAEKEFIVTVDNEVKFKDGSVNYVIGTNDGVISKQEADVTYTSGDSECKYSLDVDDNKIIHFDEKSGELKVSDYSALIDEMLENDNSITREVKVSYTYKKKSKGDKGKIYVIGKECNAGYAVNIKFADYPEGKEITDLYEVSGNKKNEKSIWYTGNVEIKPVDPAVAVVRRNDLNMNKKELGFEKSIKLSVEGTNQPEILLRSSNGGIFKPLFIEKVYIDTQDPSITGVSFHEPIFPKAISVAEKITGKILYYYGGPDKKTVKVKVEASDKNGSGIEKLICKYTYNGESKEKTIENATANKEGDYIIELTVDKDASGNLVEVKAVDKAGNESTFQDESGNEYIYDVTNPTMSLTAVISGNAKEDEKTGYIYTNQGSVEFTLTITEKNFDYKDVNIKLKRDDGDDEDYSDNVEWQDSEDDHYGRWTLTEEGTYTINITYKDKSDNAAKKITKTVVIDRTPPAVTPNFGKDIKVMFNNSQAEVELTIVDKNMNDAKYSFEMHQKSKSESINLKGKGDENNTFTWKRSLSTLGKTEDGACDVEYEVSDLCGNKTIGKCTLIIDSTKPEVRYEYTYDDNNINKVKSVTAIVDELNFDKDKTTVTLYKNGKEIKFTKDPVVWGEREGNIHEMTIDVNTNKDLKDGNYVITVNVEDAAGNVNDSKKASDTFTRDTEAPTNLNISYSKPVNTDARTNYYNNAMTVTLTATDVTSSVKEFNYSLVKTPGSSNVNRGTSTGTIEAKQDGDNKFGATIEIPAQFDGYIKFSAKDNAGNEASLEDTKRIVVDNKAPTSSVTFNTPVQNVGGTSYYDGNITATININEANFDATNIKVMATKDGVNYPVSTSWSGSGDSHTGIVTLSEDGDYNVSISGTDEANNSMTTYTSENLTIDTDITEPVITVNGLEADGKAFKDKVVPAVKFEDTNLDSYEITLLRTRYGEKNVDVTKDFIKNHMSVNMGTGVGEGEFDEFAKIQDNDGIYTLKAKITDKAGHESEKQIVFTVNRYGSIYVYDDYLVDLIADGGAYVQSIDKDLIITEYNPDKLVSQSLNVEISKDGKPLEIAAPAISPEINDRVTTGSSGWYQYQYTISKDNFAADGIYKIVVSSKDETGNNPQNTNYEDKTILFRVDSTAPEINSITGLENKIINATGVTVKYTIFDTISLASVDVYVNGEKVESVSDFGDDFNNYSGEVQLKENSSEQSVRIVATDKAGNVTDTDSSDFTSAYKFNSKVTVSTNVFVRWFANKLLFFGSIAGVLILIGGVSFLIVVLKRRKKKTA